ncbi:MAG: hypothetical protein NWP61_00015, partial [Rickettsiaceae bacterium]|nr:hypothetical protein [Rickettsiaceae bacterium]
RETVRAWCYKFASSFQEVLRKRERKPKDKWHLDGDLRVAKPDECQNQRRSIYSLDGCRFRWL